MHPHPQDHPQAGRYSRRPGLVAGFAGVILFTIVAGAVLHIDRITNWDVQVLSWLHSGTSPSGIRLFTMVSLFGSPQYLAFLGLLVTALLIWKRQWNYLYGWWLAIIGGEILESFLKFLIQRPRPEFSMSVLTHFTYSLPSGHAMTSLICYSMLSYILIKVWEPGRAARTGILATAALLITGIGFSRVYLGVHYVSDIVAGFAAGTFWVCLCIAVTNLRRSPRRGGAESSP